MAYSNYSELSPQFVSLYDSTPSPTEPEFFENALMLDNCSLPQMAHRSYSQIKSYPAEIGYIPCSLPGEECVAAGMAPFLWDTHEYVDHGAYLDGHGPLLQFPPEDLAFSQDAYSPDAYSPDAYSPDVYSPPHHVPYQPHSYTRMFRGRKSKSASEVLDELRPYACDICQAAFARSHDRDRHKRSHTGETPYQCHGCGAGFKRPDARKRHWERDPICAQEDWRRVQNTAEGAKRRARAKGRQMKPLKKGVRL